MSKLEPLTDVSVIAAITSNNDKIEDAFDNTLSRDGSAPNDMEANLDMNGHRVLNLPDAVHTQEPITLGQAATIAGVENPLTREDIGSTLYPRTTTEVSQSITPTNYYYPPGDIRRYGATTISGDNSTAIQNALKSGSPAYVPTGTWAFATTLTMTSGDIIQGEGPQLTNLYYSGSGSAIASFTPSDRTYGQQIRDIKISSTGSGTVGINMSSMSSCVLQNVQVDEFTAGISITGVNGYAVYNRFINVLVSNATTGWVIGGTGSNSTTLAYCRSNVCTTGVSITDSNHTSLEHCQFESGGVGVKITTSTSSPMSDRTTIMGCRFENNTGLSVDIDTSYVRDTALVANHFVTGVVRDLGTRTLFYDEMLPGITTWAQTTAYTTYRYVLNDSGKVYHCATAGTSGSSGGPTGTGTGISDGSCVWDYVMPQTSMPAQVLVQSAVPASANGSFRFVRGTSGLSSTPAFVIRDDIDSTGTPITLQVETEREAGSFFRGTRSSTTYFDVQANGQVVKQTHRTGSAAPTANANYVGEIFIDTTNDNGYIAIQTGAGVSDWKKITP